MQPTQAERKLTNGIPAYADVVATRALLESLKLPTELVLDILERAEYWPAREFQLTQSCQARVLGHRTNTAKVFCLEADVLPSGIIDEFGGENVKIRQIRFDIDSQDQGWTSERTEGTYATSSWLEASIQPKLEGLTDEAMHKQLERVKRPQDPVYPQDDSDGYSWYLQGNKVAQRAPLHHTVVWSAYDDEFMGDGGAGKGEGFVQRLKGGDKVQVWARAKWAGWACVVHDLKIMVRYGF
ncbi:hypothetical protein M011DRAFT_393113 [Sporormia fimetaria CBS 119925]|uniref:Uncharacterized protein n=1 Tax=Sporormia fimetaria CBS 119925 TaxID=1340428 RepID=A0A6A6VPR3_9PLEO|nr:hypothetical protein M011DRAFT_393113 [Sporormia fimetaria CBS 119925]